MKIPYFLTLALITVFLLSAIPACWAESWPIYQHDAAHTAYSESKAPNTNQTSWVSTIFSKNTSMAVSYAVVDEGKIFAGSDVGKVYCLDASTGHLLWEYKTGGSSDMSYPAVANGRVYVSSSDGTFYCLDASNGNINWFYITGDARVGFPIIADNKVYLTSGNESFGGLGNGKVSSLDASSGAIKWTLKINGFLSYLPIIANGKIYLSTYIPNESSGDTLPGFIYCLDANNGDLKWERNFLGDLTAAEGKVYVSSYNGGVYCLDGSTGETVWNSQTELTSESAIAFAYGKLYFSNMNTFYCLDASNGNLIWNFVSDNNGYSPPVIAGGKFYISCYKGYGQSDDLFRFNSLPDEAIIYCLDASRGTPLWTFTAPTDMFSSLSIAEDKAYMVSIKGSVYAFGGQVSSSAPAPSPSIPEFPLIYTTVAFIGALTLITTILKINKKTTAHPQKVTTQ